MTLLNYLASSSLLLALGAAVYGLLLRKEPYFRFNRYFILTLVVLSFLFPLVDFSGWWAEPLPLPVFQMGEVMVSPKGVLASSGPNWGLTQILMNTYLIGLGVSLMALLYRIGKLGLLLNAARKVHENGRTYRLVHTEGFLPTSSFFGYLLWDNTCNLTEEESEQIKAHEWVHIQARHSHDLLGMELAKVVLWFHPAIYWLRHHLALVHEYQADQQVIHTHSPVAYQQLMIKELFQVNPLIFSHPFNQSQLLNRIKMMNTKKKRQPWNLSVAVLSILLVMGAYSCTQEMTSNEEALSLTPVSASDEVFKVVDKGPSFPGGIESYSEYLKNNLKYPDRARENGAEGRVFLQFIITKEGKIKDAEILRGIGFGIDEEAIRFVNSMPHWQPAELDGKKVNAYMQLAIVFKLD
jgi:TonB family protein